MATIKQKPPGRWKKGESGNPKGRPAGAGEVSKIRAAIAERVPELLAKLMQQALAGDVGAARLLLERAVAPLKGIEQAVLLQLPDGGTLTAKADAMLCAAANGELAPSQAAQLITAIGTVARITETDALTTRIEKLEQQHAST